MGFADDNVKIIHIKKQHLSNPPAQQIDPFQTKTCSNNQTNLKTNQNTTHREILPKICALIIFYYFLLVFGSDHHIPFPKWL